MATTSSSVNGIMISMARAVTRQRVHQVPTATGWKMTRMMLVRPSGTTRMPKKVTIHGIVRQRLVPPMKPMSTSKVYATAPRPASEIGQDLDTFESRIVRVPSPKNGSQALGI